ncbi:hypothetical protein P3T23_008423 [Paraburkholderia sp. GAS448]|uniref:hypothetical protein n=1 Tax=Paraburkholderia sp. GAS448 TaxID=3035136 RepID=UPI003D249BE5
MLEFDSELAMLEEAVVKHSPDDEVFDKVVDDIIDYLYVKEVALEDLDGYTGVLEVTTRIFSASRGLSVNCFTATPSNSVPISTACSHGSIPDDAELVRSFCRQVLFAKMVQVRITN